MKSNLDCKSVEEILYKNSIDELNNIDKSKILNHIESCENCRTSQTLLNIIDKSLTSELNLNQLEPNPEILESLKNKIKVSKEKKSTFFDYINGFFELRIPVYQVVTGLLIFGVLSFFLLKNNRGFDSFSNNVSIIASIDSNKISMSLHNSMELIDGYKIGKSIVEDSVLSSFIQSAM